MFALFRKCFVVFSLFFLAGSLSAQGIEFFKGTWSEALAKAAAEDKLIFVDAYASWCGPCKQMAANVFPQAAVGEYFNANFINVKFDMEKEESAEFRQKHRVRAYPTLFFIDGKNEVVHQLVGGQRVEGLIAAGGVAMGKMDDLDAYAAQWEAGPRDAKLALKYIRALVRSKESHLKVTNDYLREQQDLTSDEHLNILLVAATEADSRIFDLLVEKEDAIIARFGEEAYRNQVERAVLATKAKALEYKDANLMKTAVEKMALVDAAASKQLALAGAFALAAKGSDLKTFYKAAKKYLDKGVLGENARLEEIFQTTSSSGFIHDAKVLDLAIEAGAQAAANDAATGYRQYYRLAEFLLKQGKADQALSYAKQALSTLPPDLGNYERAIQGLIQRIEESR
ncbi:thioredoxin domain-containing protein [Neolewinella lacunae]|uniref:Thioredoxin family protein n=1 Tax=Neolewinella lacunae TaxID=1517758 RepID=A0A923TAC5_9BACT|nr:thioredoxin domain-containing protein [Neolewinella lacunae]MBC6996386.1 thioredoxin family protein [Neolewinella lacunae]MDN3633671.1 thioredoxin domain-containing protein [Neolewinella lacunae]